METTPWFMMGYYEGNYRVQSDVGDMPRRAVQVQLAIIAWQMEHGELPEYLEPVFFVSTGSWWPLHILARPGPV